MVVDGLYGRRMMCILKSGGECMQAKDGDPPASPHHAHVGKCTIESITPKESRNE